MSSVNGPRSTAGSARLVASRGGLIYECPMGPDLRLAQLGSLSQVGPTVMSLVDGPRSTAGSARWCCFILRLSLSGSLRWGLFLNFDQVEIGHTVRLIRLMV